MFRLRYDPARSPAAALKTLLAESFFLRALRLGDNGLTAPRLTSLVAEGLAASRSLTFSLPVQPTTAGKYSSYSSDSFGISQLST